MTKAKLAAAATGAVLLMGPALAFAAITDTAKTQVGAAVNAAVDTRVDVGASADVQTDVDVNASSSDASQLQEDDTSASSDSNANLSLQTNADGVAVSSSEQVATDADLGIFESNVKKLDVEVSNVDTSKTDRIDVAYKHRGKLFGFIPMRVTSHTVMTVDAQGEPQVKTSMPWWNFLVSGTHSISAAVNASLSPDSPTAVLVGADASAGARARAIEAIINAHNQAEIDAKAGVTTEASTQSE